MRMRRRPRTCSEIRPISPASFVKAAIPARRLELAAGNQRSPSVDWQRYLQAGAAEGPGRRGHAAVVEDDDLLDQCEAEAGAVAFRGEERPEDPVASSRVDAGT